MLSRIFSAFFILILAGSVWAGVCGCADGSGPRMKCCKKSSAQQTMGKKRCCGTVCGAETSPGSNAATSDKGWRFSSEEDSAELSVDMAVVSFASPVAPAFAVTAVVNVNPSARPIPPDLFLLHRSLRL